MYRIIGADGREYGPISADQVRQWVVEGRANAQTRVLAEGASEWKTVGELPEFASTTSSVAPPPMPMPAIPMASPASLDQVNGPAVGLIAFAILGFLLQAVALVWQLGFSALAARQTPEAWGMLFSGTLATVSHLVAIAVSGLILFGGLKMRKLESYGLAMAASIISMIPCISPCCFIGLPIGIWALVVLAKPEVKSAFIK